MAGLVNILRVCAFQSQVAYSRATVLLNTLSDQSLTWLCLHRACRHKIFTKIFTKPATSLSTLSHSIRGQKARDNANNDVAASVYLILHESSTGWTTRTTRYAYKFKLVSSWQMTTDSQLYTKTTRLCSGLVDRMSQRKRRETKQPPSWPRSGNQISSCLVSLHFLCDILSTGPVLFSWGTRLEWSGMCSKSYPELFLSYPG